MSSDRHSPTETGPPAKHQTLHFVTGKGGVGKSAVAASLSYKLSQEGGRVLLVELGYDSYIGPSLGVSSVGFEPTQIAENLDLAVWDSESCLRDYVLHLVKVERIYKLFFENKVMRSFIDVAPGLKELAILGKATSQIRSVGPSLKYDHIVIDSYSTGHTLALFRAPLAMSEVVSRGPMGEQARSISSVLRNGEFTKYYLVATPEELPVTELIEYEEQFRSIIPIECKIILDKWIFLESEESFLAEEREWQGSLGDFINYLKFKLETQRKQLERLSGRNSVARLPLYLDSQKYLDMIVDLSKRIQV